MSSCSHEKTAICPLELMAIMLLTMMVAGGLISLGFMFGVEETKKECPVPIFTQAEALALLKSREGYE